MLSDCRYYASEDRESSPDCCTHPESRYHDCSPDDCPTGWWARNFPPSPQAAVSRSVQGVPKVERVRHRFTLSDKEKRVLHAMGEHRINAGESHEDHYNRVKALTLGGNIDSE
jgi:hypothetical protein